MARRRRICIDFDGVLHWYRQGWKGADNIYDEPVPGAPEAMLRLARDYVLHVFSARARSEEGLRAIKRWLHANEIPFDSVSATKEPGGIYVDDRGFRFEGDWDALFAQLENLDPWQKRPTTRWGRCSAVAREEVLFDLDGLKSVNKNMWDRAILGEFATEVSAREGFHLAIQAAMNRLSGTESGWDATNIIFRERVVGYLLFRGHRSPQRSGPSNVQEVMRNAIRRAAYPALHREGLGRALAYLDALDELGYPGRELSSSADASAPWEVVGTEVGEIYVQYRGIAQQDLEYAIAAKAEVEVKEQIDQEVLGELDPQGGDE